MTPAYPKLGAFPQSPLGSAVCHRRAREEQNARRLYSCNRRTSQAKHQRLALERDTLSPSTRPAPYRDKHPYRCFRIPAGEDRIKYCPPLTASVAPVMKPANIYRLIFRGHSGQRFRRAAPISLAPVADIGAIGSRLQVKVMDRRLAPFLRCNIIMLRCNSTSAIFGHASLCEGGFIWVQLTHIPPASAQIHE